MSTLKGVHWIQQGPRLGTYEGWEGWGTCRPMGGMGNMPANGRDGEYAANGRAVCPHLKGVSITTMEPYGMFSLLTVITKSC